jgi:fructose 1,6-bisphosphate aldolase/phosphatase
VPDELEYNKGYEARMTKLESKFKDMDEVLNGKAKKGVATKPKVGSRR